MPSVPRSSRRLVRRRQEQEDNIEEDDPSQRSRPEDVEDADAEVTERPTRRVSKKSELSAKAKGKGKDSQENGAGSSRHAHDADDEDNEATSGLDIDIENFKDQPIRPTDAARISYLASDWEKVLENIKRSAFRVVQEVAVAMAEAGEGQNKDALKELNRMDTVMRSFLDVQAELTAHQGILDELANEVKLGKNITNVVESYEKGVHSRKNTWQSKTSRQKYGKDNSYIEFKQAIFVRHFNRREEVQNPDEAMPPLIEMIEKEDGDESDDEDIVVGGASQVYTCPLTLRTFEDPVTSRKCKHSFSKASIQEYLGKSPNGKKCPATGCSQVLTWADFEEDKELERKVQNHLRRERQRQAAADSDDEEAEVIE